MTFYYFIQTTFNNLSRSLEVKEYEYELASQNVNVTSLIANASVDYWFKWRGI